MKKRFCILLSLLLLLSLFASCTTPKAPSAGTSGDTGTTEATDLTTEPSGDQTDPNQSALLLSALANYHVICADGADQAVAALVTEFCEALNALETGAAFAQESDTAALTDCEILIGETNRAESKDFLRTLRSGDYGYTLSGKKLVIAAHSAENLEKALDLFVSELLNASALADGVVIGEEQAKIVKGTYALDRVTLKGNELSKCVLVYPEEDSSAKLICEELSDWLLSDMGYYVPVQSDAVARATGIYEILVGETNRSEEIPEDLAAEETYLFSERKATLIAANGKYGLYHAFNLFKGLFKAEEGENRIMVNIDSEIREDGNSEKIKSMSFNLKVSGQTTERTARAVQMIKNYDPDVIGVQEANSAWMGNLKKYLPEYTWVGLDRDGTMQGEHCAIGFKTAKFNLIEEKTLWLSDTPDRVSKFETSLYTRIMTYAVLQRKSDGSTFVHVNTHLDNGEAAVRLKQAQVLIDEVEALQALYPIIVTGDFNTEPGSSVYNEMIISGYIDAKNEADEITSDGATFPGSRLIIDYFFISAENVVVNRYHVCSEKIDGENPSDHNPIYIEYFLPTFDYQ